MLKYEDILKNILLRLSQKIPVISTKGSIVKVKDTNQHINISEGFTIEKRDFRKD